MKNLLSFQRPLSLLIIFGFLGFISCKKSTEEQDEDPTIYAFNDISVSRTGDINFPIVAIHKNGDRIGVLSDLTQTKVMGALFISKDGDPFIVWTRDDGLPGRAYIEGYTLLFANYTDNSVDMAVVSSTGDIEIHRNINLTSGFKLNASKLNKLYKPTTLTLVDALKVAALSMSIAGCVSAIILSAGIAAPCGVALIAVAATLIPSDEPELETSASAFGAFASTVGCVSGDPFSCAGWVAQVASALLGSAEDDMSEKEDKISQAKQMLIGSFEEELIAYYPFNGNANDESTYDHNGTVFGATLTTDRNGNPNSAYYFDGIMDLIRVEDTAELRINTTGTFAAWLNVNIGTNYDVYDFPTILCKGAFYGLYYEDYCVGLSNPEYCYNNAEGALQWTAAHTNTPENNTGVQVPQGEWHHIAITYDYPNNEIKMYQDGILLRSTTTGLTQVRASNRNLYIGARYEYPVKGEFQGKIDDILIYNRVLTDTEIQALYNQ